MNEELTRAQQAQLDRLTHLERSGEQVGGWKLGLTSGGSRDAFGPGIRPFGFILSSRILAGGDTLTWSQVGNGGIENEICFVFQSAVEAPVTPETVRGHLAGVAPAFEINQRRIPADSPPPERIADGLANWGIVVGELQPVPDSSVFEALTVTLSHEGEPVERVAAQGHIDDQFETLARLANQLLEFGRAIQPGDKAITGAFGRATAPAPGLWTGDFGPAIGTVALRIET
jgi:2-keto-4-pentenoate hydratase